MSQIDVPADESELSRELGEFSLANDGTIVIAGTKAGYQILSAGDLSCEHRGSGTREIQAMSTSLSPEWILTSETSSNPDSFSAESSGQGLRWESRGSAPPGMVHGPIQEGQFQEGQRRHTVSIHTRYPNRNPNRNRNRNPTPTPSPTPTPNPNPNPNPNQQRRHMGGFLQG